MRSCKKSAWQKSIEVFDAVDTEGDCGDVGEPDEQQDAQPDHVRPIQRGCGESQPTTPNRKISPAIAARSQAGIWFTTTVSTC